MAFDHLLDSCMPAALCPLPYYGRWSPTFQKQCPEDPTPLPQMSPWWTWIWGLQVQASLSGNTQRGGKDGNMCGRGNTALFHWTQGWMSATVKGWSSELDLRVLLGCCLLWGSMKEVLGQTIWLIFGNSIWLNLVCAQALESDRLGLEFKFFNYKFCVLGQIAQNAPSFRFFAWEKEVSMPAPWGCTGGWAVCCM